MAVAVARTEGAKQLERRITRRVHRPIVRRLCVTPFVLVARLVLAAFFLALVVEVVDGAIFLAARLCIAAFFLAVVVGLVGSNKGRKLRPRPIDHSGAVFRLSSQMETSYDAS